MCVAPRRRAYDERVGEHEPALGVGVRDLDRLAVQRRDDVARPDRPAARACSRRPERRRATRSGSPSSAVAREPAERGGAAGHVRLHLVHPAGRLERDAAAVERDRLADEARADVSARRAGRVVVEHDQARLGCRFPGPRPRTRPSRRATISCGPSDLEAEVSEAARDLGRRARRARPASARWRACRRDRGSGSSSGRRRPARARGLGAARRRARRGRGASTGAGRSPCVFQRPGRSRRGGSVDDSPGLLAGGERQVRRRAPRRPSRRRVAPARAATRAAAVRSASASSASGLPTPAAATRCAPSSPSVCTSVTVPMLPVSSPSATRWASRPPSARRAPTPAADESRPGR